MITEIVQEMYFTIESISDFYVLKIVSQKVFATTAQGGDSLELFSNTFQNVASQINEFASLHIKANKLDEILWTYAFFYLPQRLVCPMNSALRQPLLSILDEYSAITDLEVNSLGMLVLLLHHNISKC